MISMNFSKQRDQNSISALALSDNVIGESQLGAFLAKVYKDLVHILATGPIAIPIETIVPTKLEILLAVVF